MMRMTRWPWCWGRWPAVAVQRCLVPPFSVSRACGIDLVSMFEQGEESLMFVGEQLREDTRSQSSRCQESCYILEYIFFTHHISRFYTKPASLRICSISTTHFVNHMLARGGLFYALHSSFYASMLLLAIFFDVMFCRLPCWLAIWFSAPNLTCC